MTTTVVAVSSTEPVVLTPDVSTALQASLAYLTANKQTANSVQSLVSKAENAAIAAQAAEDQILALVAVYSLQKSLQTLFQNLPTTQPSTPGQLWNDGNLLALS